jgi:hypothetical protein
MKISDEISLIQLYHLSFVSVISISLVRNIAKKWFLCIHAKEENGGVSHAIVLV